MCCVALAVGLEREGRGAGPTWSRWPIARLALPPPRGGPRPSAPRWPCRGEGPNPWSAAWERVFFCGIFEPRSSCALFAGGNQHLIPLRTSRNLPTILRNFLEFRYQSLPPISTISIIQQKNSQNAKKTKAPVFVFSLLPPLPFVQDVAMFHKCAVKTGGAAMAY